MAVSISASVRMGIAMGAIVNGRAAASIGAMMLASLPDGVSGLASRAPRQNGS